MRFAETDMEIPLDTARKMCYDISSGRDSAYYGR
jgi:hypothetical protein